MSLLSANDEFDLERLRILENKLRNWIQEAKPFAAECFYQSHRVQECLSELGELVCEDLGYHRDDDDDL